MYNSLRKRLKVEIDEIKESGRYKERIILSPQKSIIWRFNV